MIQRSIHTVSDCSFSLFCPAVLPHYHSGSNERSGSPRWYNCCHCSFICDDSVCCFVICSESISRAPRFSMCNGCLCTDLEWVQLGISGAVAGVSCSPPGKWRLVEWTYTNWDTYVLHAIQCYIRWRHMKKYLPCIYENEVMSNVEPKNTETEV